MSNKSENKSNTNNSENNLQNIKEVNEKFSFNKLKNDESSYLDKSQSYKENNEEKIINLSSFMKEELSQNSKKKEMEDIQNNNSQKNLFDFSSDSNQINLLIFIRKKRNTYKD